MLQWYMLSHAYVQCPTTVTMTCPYLQRCCAGATGATPAADGQLPAAGTSGDPAAPPVTSLAGQSRHARLIAHFAEDKRRFEHLADLFGAVGQGAIVNKTKLDAALAEAKAQISYDDHRPPDQGQSVSGAILQMQVLASDVLM
jgi:hypothetical protein